MCATHGEPVCTGGGVCGMAVTAQAMRARRGGISGDLSGLAWVVRDYRGGNVISTFGLSES